MAQANQQSSFLSEVFAAGLYKKTQGRVVRQATAAVVALLAIFAAYRLYGFLVTAYEVGREASLIAALLFALAGFWLGFRLVNWPRFADFLINVEIEMSKVSWASWDYLVRATIVVVSVMFLTGAVLFAFDLFWKWFFELIGFIDVTPVAEPGVEVTS